MRTRTATLAVAALGLCLPGCGAYGTAGTAGSPTAPSGAIVIQIAGINGAQSFSPNPATVPSGQMVVWHNADAVRHRVVLNDRSVDTGDIDPGLFSAPMELGATGGYHCEIHPIMIGTVAR